MNKLFKFMIIIIVHILITGCSFKESKPKRFKVGIINLTPTLEPLVKSFKKNLQDFGYIENNNISYIYNGYIKKNQNIDEKVNNLLKQKVDLILSISTKASLIVKKHTSDKNVPVLFAPVSYPVESGLVKTLRRPEYNLTGIRGDGYIRKALEWLIKVIPDLKKIYVPYNPVDISMTGSLKELNKAALNRNIELQIVTVKSNHDVLEALDNIPEDVQAIWELASYYWGPYVKKFINASIKHKKALMTITYEWTEMGAMISFGGHSSVIGKQAGRLAHKILKGISPSVIPVEQADFYLTINLHTAKSIGVSINKNILKHADFIIR